MILKYKRKIEKKKVFLAIIIVILIILIAFFITKKTMVNNLELNDKFLKNYSTVVDDVKYSLTIDNNVVYENSFELKIEIDDKDETSKYKVIVSLRSIENVLDSSYIYHDSFNTFSE